ncbi:hypothetical protein IWZ03DRAFT_416997 [Phyllosticta citriasiana]|uniref:Uncharacterized protein n=1 Tax=Phyllosticta citriasiana TaxID=595635 RepID=A0ABR1KDH5_9PEZI
MSARTPSASDISDPYARYLYLSSQQESLRQRLTVQIPPTDAYATANYSPRSSFSSDISISLSGTHSPLSHSPTQTPTTPFNTAAHNTPGACSSPVPDLPHHSHHAASKTGAPHSPSQVRNGAPLPADSALYDVNKQVKAVLTELLNTDNVRRDERFRAFVQSRLMDTELEMRRQRRRRSSVDREVLDSIAEHFGDVGAASHYA